MRIISQDGMFDLPYKLISIDIKYRKPDAYFGEWVIVAESIDTDTNYYVAWYSTEKKAKNAVKMLREWYSKMFNPYFQFPQDEEV